MSNLFAKYDHLNFKERLDRGKKFEEIIDSVLLPMNRKIKQSTLNEDMHEKIDRIEELPDGTTRKLAYKARTSGDDILLDLYEPFYGIDNTATRPGRDLISPYDRYFCLERGGGNLREIDGAVQKMRIKEVLTEWADCSYFLSRGWFNSVRVPGISLKYHVDKSNDRPKIIMFIKPSVYKENEEIWYYKVNNE
jgi:hypothetical protein